MEADIIVVGSGLAGSVAAREFAELGKKVVIFEKNSYVGGNCFDYFNEEGIPVHLHGPHIFHTNNKTVWDYVNQFTTFYNFQHKVVSYINGDYIPFPINKATVHRLFDENDLSGFLEKEIQNSTFNTPAENFRDVIVSQVGERLYNLFYKNYTKKQWQTNPENLSTDLAFRIPVRYDYEDRYFSDIYQGIPFKGYTAMIKDILDHENIFIELETDYFDVKDNIEAELIVYTGQLDRFFDYEFGTLQYRSLKLEFETKQVKEYQPVAVVNYPNDYGYTRVTEFKHFLGLDVEKTTVLYEYPSSSGHPYYIVPSKENSLKRDKYMKKVEYLESQGTHLFIGRLAEYKYYNMDQVIEAALDKVNQHSGVRQAVRI